MKIKELKTWLTENIDNESARIFFKSDFPDINDPDLNPNWYEDEVIDFANVLKEKQISYKEVDSYGGEGQGDDFWVIVEFSSGDTKVNVKFDGWYQSYNGSEYTEWFFVKPKKVSVVEWNKEK